MAVNFAKHCLLQHIKQQPPDIRRQLWDWLDGDPEAIHQLIEAAADGLEEKKANLYVIGFLDAKTDPGPQTLLTMSPEKMPSFNMIWGPNPMFLEAKEQSYDRDDFRHYYMLRGKPDDKTFKPIRRFHKRKWVKLENFKG